MTQWLLRSLTPLANLPEALANIVNPGSFRGMASPHDVISLIKKHICDNELSQPPLLVLTHHRALGVNLVPTEKQLSHVWDSGQSPRESAPLKPYGSRPQKDYMDVTLWFIRVFEEPTFWGSKQVS